MEKFMTSFVQIYQSSIKQRRLNANDCKKYSFEGLKILCGFENVFMGIKMKNFCEIQCNAEVLAR